MERTQLRPDSDGRPDARNRRFSGHYRHPRKGARIGRPHSHHRDDRLCFERRSRTVSRRGYERLSDQADRRPAPARTGRQVFQGASAIGFRASRIGTHGTRVTAKTSVFPTTLLIGCKMGRAASPPERLRPSALRVPRSRLLDPSSSVRSIAARPWLSRGNSLRRPFA